MQRGLGEAARSWGGSAAKGGLPHSLLPFPQRLPWFPPLALCMADNVLTFMGSAISSPERLSIKFYTELHSKRVD
ncbi:MAG: hypothetical protein F6K55_21185 [Moorea sp. SIO4A3]|nr:hypothetical protein [Moorena sp. SIO4A3]